MELTDALREDFGDFTVDFNPEKPRRGSFEVTMIKEDGSGMSRTFGGSFISSIDVEEVLNCTVGFYNW